MATGGPRPRLPRKTVPNSRLVSDTTTYPSVDDEASMSADDSLTERWEGLFKTPCKDNLLVVGVGGVGKSSLINTLGSSVIGKYVEIAPFGAGNAITKTTRLYMFKHLGLTTVENDDSIDLNIRKLIPNLPHIFDLPALTNSNTEEQREVLRAILEGRVIPGTLMEDLTTFQHDIGTGVMEQMEDFQIDVLKQIKTVLFVHSGTEQQVPTSLVECLLQCVANAATGGHDIRIFVVVTKEDKFGKDKTTFEAVEKQLIESFSIKGAVNRSLVRMRNLCDDNGYEEPSIHTEALQLMQRIIVPRQPAQEGFKWPRRRRDRIKAAMFKMQRKAAAMCNTNNLTLAVFVIVAVILAGVVVFLLFRLLVSPVPEMVKSDQSSILSETGDGSKPVERDGTLTVNKSDTAKRPQSAKITRTTSKVCKGGLQALLKTWSRLKCKSKHR